MGDSRLALSLLLELALQRGTLSAMLCAVLLLLELANRSPERTAQSLKEGQGVGPYEEGEGEENNEQVKDNELFGAALNEVAVVPFLQRLASVEAEGGTVLLTEKKGDPAKVWLRACLYAVTVKLCRATGEWSIALTPCSPTLLWSTSSPCLCPMTTELSCR